MLHPSHHARPRLIRLLLVPTLIVAALAGLFVTERLKAAGFVSGNLAILVTASSAVTSNTTGSIVEISSTVAGQTGTGIQTIPIPGSGVDAYRISGSATSTGYVSSSNDRTLLTFTGANSADTTNNVNTLNPRGVFAINSSAAVVKQTTYTGTSGNQTRSATSLNNTTWFISDQGGLYTNGASAASPSGNFRAAKSFGGTVYLSQASSTATTIQVVTIAAPSGATVAGLPGLTNNANLQDFYLVQSGDNGTTYDILYVLSATSNTAGTIAKYSLVAGSWAANGAYTTAFGGFGLAAADAGANEMLYVSTGQGALAANSVIKVIDAAGYNATINVTTSNNVTLYTTAAGTIIKGLDFAPVAPAIPTVNLSVTTNSASEAAVTAVTVMATASAAVTGTQTVNLAVTGTNITVGDYTLTNGVITIPNGLTTGSVTFTVVDDFAVEGAETATLTIGSPSAGIVLGGTTTQNVSIADNDVSVDLSRYVRVGRFDLPEPTRTTPPTNSLLAQEASAVTYNWDTDTLFVVGDGGTSVVQVSKTGQLINSMTLAPGSSPQGTDFYDTEGIAYVGGGKFVFTEERDRQAVLFTYAAGATLNRAGAQTVKLGTTIGNVGLEGLSYDPQTGGFIFVKEKDPQSIFQTLIDFNAGAATNGSPTATGSTDLFNPTLASLADFSDVYALSNLPALSGQPEFSHLLVISQESGQIVNVDRAGAVYSRLTIVADAGSPLTVPDMTMEGVAMDRDGKLYVVNENGGGDANHPQLWVYAPSNAPNLAPTAVTLVNPVTSLPENTSTAVAVKVADISVTDDGIGTNNLAVSGTDASSFQVIGTGLFLKAGTTLNATTKPSYSVTVTVDDATVGGIPDASVPFSLTVTSAAGGTPSLIISEVAPWSSGNSTIAVDWFEVTNTGASAVNITGWKFNDSAASFASAVPLSGITAIAAGESVIFIQTPDLPTAKTAFLNLWFGASPPAGLQFGSYPSPGLSTGGDAVNVYDTAGTVQASVNFGASTTASPFKTFDNAAGLNNATITALSAVGVNGAFSITDGASTEIGSPGTIGVASSTPLVTIVATDANAAEAGQDPGTFRISRTGGTVGPLTANYTIAAGVGQATSGDYTPTLTGVVTIASGQSFVDITITPIDDSLVEGSETVTLTLGDTGSYDVGAPGTATVTIADNDAANLPPTVVVLNNTVPTITEITPTTSAIKLADIAVTDDGVGTNTLGLSGADGGFFNIIGSSLFLKAGTVLNFAAKPAYNVTVTVDDTTVGATPDASVNFTLTVLRSPVPGSIIVSEVAPWSSGNSLATLRVDWFEVTNTGAVAANITGWKWNDSANVYSSASALNGIASIAPGESVIFLDTADLPTKKAAFLSLWFGANPPAGLQFGSYTGPGLGTGGDSVNLFDTSGNRMTGIAVGASPTGTFFTFDNRAGAGSATLPLPTVLTLSAVGVNGAFVAVNDVNEIGSPGTIVNGPAVNLSVSTNSASEAAATVVTVTATASSAVSGNQTVSLAVTGTDITAGDYTLSNTTITILSGQTSGSVTFTVVDDSVVESTETAVLTISAPSFGITLGGTIARNITITDNDAPPACSAPHIAINQVQGSGNASLLVGQVVTVRGVVVGDYEGAPPALRGFFIQDLAADDDGNPATSEGIFVFEANNANTVSLGQVVQVTGTVSEFNGLTEITGGTIESCGTTASPAPVDVTLPVADATYLERFEGMLVRFHQTLYVTEHFQLGQFGQILMSSGARLPQPTNILAPGASAIAQQGANDLNKIIVDDDLNGQDPDPIKFGRSGNPLSASNTLRGGDTATDIVGVVTYDFGDYHLRPINAFGGGVPNFQPANPRPAAPPSVGARLKVAGMNVLNYFLTLDNGASICGPAVSKQQCRGAETAAELARQQQKLNAALLKVDADVFGFSEIENTQAVASGLDVNPLADIVNRLNGSLGGDVYSYVNTGIVGTDTIRVGLVYKKASVTPVGSFLVDTNPIHNRPPVAQLFAENATGERFSVVANHFKSKSCGAGADAATGADMDQGDGQGCWNAKRTQQATALVSFVNTVVTTTGDRDVLLVGDFNAYAKEDPVHTLETAGFTNLIARFSGAGAYSYVFNGQWGYLDHGLASSSLLAQVTNAGDYHINADEPSVLDYNTNFKSAGQVVNLFNADEFRIADHDPVLIGISLYPFPQANPDQFTAQAGTPLSVNPAQGVLANDTGGTLAILGQTNTLHGTITLNADGSFSYTPAPGYTGPDSFDYSVSNAVRRYGLRVYGSAMVPLATIGGVKITAGAFGSSFTPAPGSPNEFYGLTDRGPNVDDQSVTFKIEPIPTFTPSIGKFKFIGDGAQAVLEQIIPLQAADGTPYSGRVNTLADTGETIKDLNGNVLTKDLNGYDPEGLVALPDGTFWVSDEYGPFITHFDATGKQLSRLSPFDSTLPVELRNRVINRGMEGLTVTPDGTMLVGIMQSALQQLDLSGFDAKKLTPLRIVTYTLATGQMREYLYLLDNPNTNKTAVSEITALSNTLFLVDERDGNFLAANNPASAYKKLYLIDITGATDVGPDSTVGGSTYQSIAPYGGRLFGGKTIENLVRDGFTPQNTAVSTTTLAGLGITPVTKTLYIDIGGLLLAADPLARFFSHDKLEGVAALNGGATIIVSNDSDFGIDGVTNANPPFQLHAKVSPVTGVQDEGEFLVIDLIRSSATATINVVDTVAPETTLNGMPSNPTSSAVATFDFSGSDAGSGVATFECSLDSAPFGACTSGATYAGIVHGGHSFAVRAIDGSNNVDATPAVYAWTVVSPGAPAVTRSGFVRDRRTGAYAQEITITNIDASPLTGPFQLALDALGSNATLINATGTTTVFAPLGSPYITVPGGTLGPGASASVVLQFSNPTDAGITYTMRVLSGVTP